MLTGDLGRPRLIPSALMRLLYAHRVSGASSAHPICTDETAVCSQGIWGVLGSFVGEAHHLDHHMKPRRERRPGLDAPWYITVPLWRAVGLVAPAATAAAGDTMASPPMKTDGRGEAAVQLGASSRLLPAGSVNN